jgi:hypothetical protein
MFGKTILFSEMVPAPSWEGAFNDWYDEEHIPLRMGAPGFVSAQRYRAEARDYLAVYEMDSAAALRTAEYQVIKSQPSDRTRRMLGGVSGFTRYIGNEISTAGKPAAEGAASAKLLYAVWFNVPQDRLAAFDAWYDEDHVPILLEHKDWIAVRRFEIVDGEPESWNRLALHYLGAESALQSPERARARETPWRARLAVEPWFRGSYKVFQQHGARQQAGA